MSLTGAITTNGLTVAIGPLAATLDPAGFGAVSYDVIGEVTDPGALGKTYNTASYTPTAGDRAVKTRKTSFTRTNPTITIAVLDGDAGQIAAEAALDSDDCFSIRYTRQNGAIIYFSAQVSQFERTFTTDDFETATLTLLTQSDGVTVAAP